MTSNSFGQGFVRGPPTPFLMASCCPYTSSWFLPTPLLLRLVSRCRPACGNASKAHCRIAKTMLVENNITEADDVVQIGLYKDPEHTELNALQVSIDLLDLRHRTQLIVRSRLAIMHALW